MTLSSATHTCSLFFIRHGRTTANEEGRLQGGGFDAPILEEAYPVMSRIRERMRREQVAVYCSPQQRAKITANEVFGDGVLAVYDCLRELHFGVHTGAVKTELDPSILEARAKDKWNFRWEGGESLADVHARVAGLAGDLRRRMDRGSIAVVGHETTNCVLIGSVLAWEPSQIIQIKQPNNRIYIITKNTLSHEDL